MKLRYADGMSPSEPNPVSAESTRSRFRIPHWGWFLLATVALVKRDMLMATGTAVRVEAEEFD